MWRPKSGSRRVRRNSSSAARRHTESGPPDTATTMRALRGINPRRAASATCRTTWCRRVVVDSKPLPRTYARKAAQDFTRPLDIGRDLLRQQVGRLECPVGTKMLMEENRNLAIVQIAVFIQ